MVVSKWRQDKHAFDDVTAATLLVYSYRCEQNVVFRARVLNIILGKTGHKSCAPFEFDEFSGFVSFDEHDAMLVVRAQAESKSRFRRIAKNSIEIECGRVDKTVQEHALTLWKHAEKQVRELNRDFRQHLIGHAMGGSIAFLVVVNILTGGHRIQSVTAFGPSDGADVRVRSYLAKQHVPVTQFYQTEAFGFRKSNVNDSSNLQPLYLSFSNRKHVRAKCTQCSTRFKISSDQNQKRVRCPDCLQAHVVIADQQAASTSQWRPRIWGLLFVVASFVAGYFVGRMHFKYLVIETLKDMQLNP